MFGASVQSLGSGSHATPRIPIAFLVPEEEDEDAEVVVAEPLGYLEDKWKLFVAVLSFLLLVALPLALVLGLVLGARGGEGNEEELAAVVEKSGPPKYCSPCIDRKAYTILALLYGDDSIPDMLVPAALRSAKDLGVNLDVVFYERRAGDEQMVADIRSTVEPGSEVDALIVTVFSKEVASAVRYVADRDMPVFGMHCGGFEFGSGPEGLVQDGSTLFFAGMDKRLGGEMAASYFLDKFSLANAGGNDDFGADLSEKYTDALFVTPAGDQDPAYQQQFEGYRDRLMEASDGAIKVDWVKQQRDLEGEFYNCKYQSVLVGHGSLFPAVASAIDQNGCGQVKVGTFDPALVPAVKSYAGQGRLDFAIDQLHHLQGWSLVQFAALFLTAGLVVTPLSGGVYSSGPVFLTQNSLAEYEPKTILCEEVVNQTDNLPWNRKCHGQKKVTIGGVVHGNLTSRFWDTVYSAANQSSTDMGVELIFDQIELTEDKDVLYEKLASKILDLCEQVDGLFVTLPDEIIVNAVMQCQRSKPDMQIMSINAGYELSKKLKLIHHVGMMEEDAGYQAGREMVKMATFNKALCANSNTWLNSFNERCKGFERAMNEAGIRYLGQVSLQEDKITQYKANGETEVVELSNMDDYGVLLTRLAELPAALELKKLHGNFVMGSFDTSTLLYESLRTGDVLFGIDQEPYLQGYLPVSLLTHAATTKQYFLDHSVQSGPRFVIAPPTDEVAACEELSFPVCLTDEKSMVISSILQTGTTQPTLSMQPSPPSTAHPSSSMQPSFSPSFDPRQTLEVVQSRGHVRCGLGYATIESGEGFFLDLCRAVASVVLGNPDNFVGVLVTGGTRFQKLSESDVDLLLFGDTYTIEREVRERTTGAGFTFSSPYYYDGMAYFGEERFVQCAEEQKRFNDCSSLMICVNQGSTGYDFVRSSFPSYLFVVGSSNDEALNMLWNNECNVLAGDRSKLLNFASSDENNDGKFIVGDKMFSKEPLAAVTRNSDREFSDIINWVVHALFYGEEQGLSKESSLCHSYPNLTSHMSGLNFLNAVHCVGSYGELLDSNESRGMNQINDGTTGMLYAIPFGKLETVEDSLRSADTTASVFLGDIVRKESLNCGVVVPADFIGEIQEINQLAGMNVEYCYTLAAALFRGDSEIVNIMPFPENDNSSLVALNNGTIDVLAGGRVEKESDFRSPSVEGIQFSTPYYYGNEASGYQVTFIALATREDDVVFSSFVNCVVLATIFAQENRISREDSNEMPLVSIFGTEFRWALRDAISYSGNYDQIYARNFGEGIQNGRGRNALNDISGPQLHSFPGVGESNPGAMLRGLSRGARAIVYGGG